MAHDFNNLLTVILSHCTFLLADIPKRPEALQWRKYAPPASGANLIRQLMAFSRKQLVQFRAVNLNLIIADLENLLRRLIGENIKLRISLAPDLIPAKGDRGQLEQVIMNLAVNARDAMPGGGILSLQTGRAEIAGETCPRAYAAIIAPGNYALLTMTDTGIGMDEATMSRIFEPFYTTKEQGKGTGLGLATVYGIIKQSGGFIDVKSAPGNGSVFSVYLPFAETPLQDKDKDKASARVKEPPIKGQETVLLVEDEESLRRVGARVLLAAGYTVLTAADGQAAVKLIGERGKSVDLLMTDVLMPGMSGRELARELARRKMIGRTLYMSGYTDDAIIKYGVLEPGIAFIYKPFTVDALLLKLREVLDGPADQAKA